MPTSTSPKALLTRLRDDPDRFNAAILGRPRYWWRQVQVCRSIVEHRTTLVPAGNAVGKSFLAAGLVHWFLFTRPGSLVITTAPSQTQLEQVLWKEVFRSHSGARVPLGGSLYKQPLSIDCGGGWKALGYSTTKTERLSGHHAPELLAVIDESSGVLPEIIEAIDSLNPSRLVLIGNPLRPDGPFYERCLSAEGNPHSNVITIPSLDSPDIDEARSHRGLADRTWLEGARHDYGEGSIWWKSHVLALFPDSADDSVVPRSWLDRAGAAVHLRAGPTRLAIDLAGGHGGNRSVVLVRDDNGLLALDSSNTWSLADTAAKAAAMARRHGVEHQRITWDVAGLGEDFANRLQAAGMVGCTPYRGGSSGGTKFGNLRSAAAWQMRQRLDPERKDAQGQPLPAFAIRPDWLATMRDELQGLRYSLDNRGRIALEDKEKLKRLLRHSPDFADALGQSFAFPNA